MAIVGIMDSGIGGLSVYKEIVNLLPNCKYFYYADRAFCPYGNRSEDFIKQRCQVITDEFIRRGVNIIVIACNTATAAAISYLRATYPFIPFVGMEPAVKPAALGTKSGVIGVLATAGTLRGSKYLKSKDIYSSNIKIVENIGTGFVEIVEKAFIGGQNSSNFTFLSSDNSITQDSDKFIVDALFDKSILCGKEAQDIVSQSLTPLLQVGADTIVLGCTHYPFLLEAMTSIANSFVSTSSIRFIDPAPAIAAHLSNLLKEGDQKGHLHSSSL